MVGGSRTPTDPLVGRPGCHRPPWAPSPFHVKHKVKAHARSGRPRTERVLGTSRMFVRVAARAGGPGPPTRALEVCPSGNRLTPASRAQILPTVVPGRARGLRISVRPRTPLRRGAEGARRASGKLHGKDGVTRSDPPPLATCEREDCPALDRYRTGERRVVEPHGGDRAGGVGRLAAGCGIRTAEVGPVCRTAGRVRRIRTAEVGRAAAATCGFVCGGRPT